MKQALQQGTGQGSGGSGLGQTAQKAQERLVLEKMQKLGLVADGMGNMNPGQLQGLVEMLNKQSTLVNLGRN